MKDIEIYKERMAKTMTRAEKLFFMDHLDLYTYDAIIDFGGASGLLVYEIQRHYPDLADKCRFIIVDPNPQMQTDYELKNYARVASLDKIGELRGRVLLICSSVLHECWPYDIERLYEFCKEHVSTLAMRDMAYTDRDFSSKTLDERHFWVEAGSTYQKICENEECRVRFYEMLHYCNEWGQNVKQTLTHFILKCDYRENWESEICENYFNNHVITLMGLLVYDEKWRKLFYRNYPLPYKKAQAKTDFDFDLPNTHVQIILERPEEEKV